MDTNPPSSPIVPESGDRPDDRGVDAPIGTIRMNALSERESTYSDRDRALLRMSGATRGAIAEVLSTTAEESVIEDAADLVERAVALLAGRPHGRQYEGRAEGSLRTANSSVDHSPFVGGMNPLAPPITMRFVDERVIGTVVYGPPYEGPPGCVHGGFIAAGFDEVLGFVQALNRSPGMTARLEVSYRSPTPLWRELRYEGWVVRVDGRKIYTEATLSHGATLCAEATGLFISMKPEVFNRLLSSRIDSPAGES
jgi:acyl-coenzyme A thioesterase PaaI-like protein